MKLRDLLFVFAVLLQAEGFWIRRRVVRVSTTRAPRFTSTTPSQELSYTTPRERDLEEDDSESEEISEDIFVTSRSRFTSSYDVITTPPQWNPRYVEDITGTVFTAPHADAHGAPRDVPLSDVTSRESSQDSIRQEDRVVTEYLTSFDKRTTVIPRSTEPSGDTSVGNGNLDVERTSSVELHITNDTEIGRNTNSSQEQGTKINESFTTPNNVFEHVDDTTPMYHNAVPSDDVGESEEEDTRLSSVQNLNSLVFHEYTKWEGFYQVPENETQNHTVSCELDVQNDGPTDARHIAAVFKSADPVIEEFKVEGEILEDGVVELKSFDTVALETAAHWSMSGSLYRDIEQSLWAYKGNITTYNSSVEFLLQPQSRTAADVDGLGNSPAFRACNSCTGDSTCNSCTGESSVLLWALLAVLMGLAMLGMLIYGLVRLA